MKIECSLNVLEKDWWFDIGLSCNVTEYLPTKYVLTIAFIFFSIYIRFGKHTHKCKWVTSKSEFNNITYYTRSCSCGRRQLQANGGLGDNKWHDDDMFDFKFPHEKDNYFKAVNR